MLIQQKYVILSGLNLTFQLKALHIWENNCVVHLSLIGNGETYDA